LCVRRLPNTLLWYDTAIKSHICPSLQCSCLACFPSVWWDYPYFHNKSLGSAQIASTVPHLTYVSVLKLLSERRWFIDHKQMEMDYLCLYSWACLMGFNEKPGSE